MLKILQARLQQYMNCELPDVQAGFRKGRGTRDQIANNHRIIEKAKEFQKSIYFCFIDYAFLLGCLKFTNLEPVHFPMSDFSGGRSGGLVFPSLEEFSTVCCDLHSQKLWHSQLSRTRCFSGILLLFL